MAFCVPDLPLDKKNQPGMTSLTSGPETRQSLLIRLRNSRDDQAWAEFTAIYEPVIYRMSQARGLQDADAREVVQEVLMSVSAAIEHFDVESAGSFRGWLTKITRNATIDHFRRRAKRMAAIGSEHVLLEEIAGMDQLEDEFDRSRREQLFRWASSIVRRRTGEANWIAFWSTAVEGRPIPEVAAELGVTEGAIYVARCRIIKRIRELVKERLED